MMFEKWKYDGDPSFQMNDLQRSMKEQIEWKLKQGIYLLEMVNCGVCNGNEFKKLAGKDRFGLPMSVVICKMCGLIQTNPRMNQSAYNEFYNDEYRKLLYGKESPSDWFFSVQFRRGQRIYEYLKHAQVLPSPSSRATIFEVGCGAGGVLQYFKEKGYCVRGVDLDKKYLAFGKQKYDLDISEGTIRDVILDVQPKVIIYSHVLEHILSPKDELAQIRKMASQNTILYIEVPGIKNLMRTWDMNFLMFLQFPHVYHFTLTSLRNLLENNGFILIGGNEFIRSVFKKSAAVKSTNVIISDCNSARMYLRKTEILRRLLPAPPYRWKGILLSFISRTLQVIGIHDIVKNIYRKQ